MVNLLKYGDQLVNTQLPVSDWPPYPLPTLKYVHIYIHKYFLAFVTIKKKSHFTHLL